MRDYKTGKDALQRLDLMCATENGFDIAEEETQSEDYKEVLPNVGEYPKETKTNRLKIWKSKQKNQTL